MSPRIYSLIVLTVLFGFFTEDGQCCLKKSEPDAPAPPPGIKLEGAPTAEASTLAPGMVAGSSSSLPADSCGWTTFTYSRGGDEQGLRSVPGNSKKKPSSSSPQRGRDRIIAGHDVQEAEIPWQARIESKVLTGTEAGSRYLCGGSIIADSWVITAAHCVIPDSNVKVLAGGNTISSETNEATAVVTSNQQIKHPNYNARTGDYDIALVRLSKPLTFTDKIQPICLPDSCTNDCQTDAEAIITGWGTKSQSDSEAQATLQKAKVVLVSSGVCRQGFTNHKINRTLTDRMVCAGDPSTGADTCKGDDGGPLACVPASSNGQYYLTGVKSIVDKCGAAGFYSTYTKPCSVISWIRGYLGKTTPKPTTAATTAATTAEPTAEPTAESTAAPTTAEVTGETTQQAISGPAATKGWTNHPECGKRNGVPTGPTTTPIHQVRIVGGKNAVQNEFPWQVRIETNDFICGGSIITNDWILTAAHCIDPESVGDAKSLVFAGAHYLNQRVAGEVVLEHVVRVQHPDYNAETHDNDIALIKLNRSLTFSDKVRPICMLGSDCDNEADPGTMCAISG